MTTFCGIDCGCGGKCPRCGGGLILFSARPGGITASHWPPVCLMPPRDGDVERQAGCRVCGWTGPVIHEGG